jgi:hypothetical protein
MWDFIVERLPKGLTLFLIFMSGVGPWLIYKINQWLHQKGDPPWKKDSSRTGTE